MDRARFCCDATSLGRREIKGCVTSQSLHVLIDHLRNKRRNFPSSTVSENECQIECSVDGLKIFYKRNDEGFESDADSGSPRLPCGHLRGRRKNSCCASDSDSSSDGGNKTGACEVVQELFAFEDIHFCHTEPENARLIVWVTVSKQPQTTLGSTRHARVFECVNETSALKLAQVFSEQSKRLRLERYRHALSNSTRTRPERGASSARSQDDPASTEGNKFYLECEEIFKIAKTSPYAGNDSNPGKDAAAESLGNDFRILSVRQRISPILLRECDEANRDGSNSGIFPRKKHLHGKGPAPLPPHFPANYVPNSILIPCKSGSVTRRSTEDSSNPGSFRFRLIPMSAVGGTWCDHDRSNSCRFFPLSPGYSAFLVYPSEINVNLENGKRSGTAHHPCRQNFVRRPAASFQISCSEMPVLSDSFICWSRKLKDFKIFLRRKIHSPSAKISSDCGNTAVASRLPLEMQRKSVMKKASDKSAENKKVTFNDYAKVQFVD